MEPALLPPTDEPPPPPPPDDEPSPGPGSAKRARVDDGPGDEPPLPPEAPPTSDADGPLLTQPKADPGRTSRHRFATVCSSNVNRSVESSVVLHNAGFDVKSFGCGSGVKLPGPKGARAFEFGTRYADMADTLLREDPEHYNRLGLVDLLRRAGKMKLAPSRWQDAESTVVASFDVVLCFEFRLFDTVVADIQQRDPQQFTPIHVVCVDTRDTPQDAVNVGRSVLDLCKLMDASDLSREVDVGALCLSGSKSELQYMLLYL